MNKLRRQKRLVSLPVFLGAACAVAGESLHMVQLSSHSAERVVVAAQHSATFSLSDAEE